MKIKKFKKFKTNEEGFSYSDFLEWFNNKIYMVPKNWSIEEEFNEILDKEISKKDKIQEIVDLIEFGWEHLTKFEYKEVLNYLKNNIK